MPDEKLKQNPTVEGDWETWDSWNEDLDKALPNWDRWNNDLKQLLPEDKRTEEKETMPQEKEETGARKEKAPIANLEKLTSVQKKIPDTEPPAPFEKEEPVRMAQQKPEILSSDKELLFFVQKYKRADKICQEAGINLQTLQHKVGYLSYRLKRYIDIEGLYRDNAPVKLTDDGIHISKDHLIESGFETGDRFKIDFKDKYIVLSRLHKPIKEG